jgi:glyoxylase-like metal-dependent hydrolase (beta-lactamase superfamily II)
MVEGWTEDDDHDPSEEDDEKPTGDSAADEEKEGLDTDFRPDITVRDGDTILSTGGITLRAVHTPGHTSNHLCVELAEESTLFTGDHVMGWSTTVVSPPDGDMAAYFDSMRKVIGRGDSLLRPTHGGPVTDPQPFLRAYLQHRVDREEQVLSQLRSGTRTIPAMVKVLYADVDKRLHRPARRSVWSHVLKLHAEGRVRVAGGGEPRLLAEYEPTD